MITIQFQINQTITYFRLPMQDATTNANLYKSVKIADNLWTSSSEVKIHNTQAYMPRNLCVKKYL